MVLWTFSFWSYTWTWNFHQKVLAYSGDLEASGGKPTSKGGGAAHHSHKKHSVGINPWKLARISTEEATKAAAQAREASSIIRPIKYLKGSSQVTETEESSLESSRSVSGEITIAGNKRHRRKHDLAYLTGKERWLLMKERRDKSVALNRNGILTGMYPTNGSPQSIVLPLPLEARHAYRCSPSRFSGELRSSFPGSSYPGSSYPGSQLASPDIFQESPDMRSTPPKVVIIDTSPVIVKDSGKVTLLHRSGSDGYEASAGESGDENVEQLQGLIPPLNKKSLDSSIVTPREKVSVWESCPDHETVIPRISSGARSVGSRGSRSSKADSAGGGFYLSTIIRQTVLLPVHT